jgi:tRNA nucleotidyltransferase (CCA-adding enzyme)
MLMNAIFEKAVPLIERIEQAGYEAYFVGGSVRDYLIKRPINDVDIATSATPQEVKQLFRQTVDLGIEHGTVMVIFEGIPYEITTFRTESEYKDFRKPEKVQFVRSLREDLNRRDFTMNAIAMNRKGEVIDPFNGHQAILDRKITAVGAAEERFSEDALRMMRAIRFVSQLSFSLDDSCCEALIKLGSLLNYIAVERKTSEFEKLLIGKDRIRGIHLLNKTELFRYLPGLDSFEHELKVLTQFACQELELEEMWSLLVYCLKLPISEVGNFLNQWKLPVKKIREIQAIYQWTLYRMDHDWSKIDIFHAGKANMVQAQRLCNVLLFKETNETVNHCLEQYEDMPIKSRSEVAFSGTDLMELLNRPAGPWIKDYLSKIEKTILEGKLVNQPEKIREWVLGCNLK